MQEEKRKESKEAISNRIKALRAAKKESGLVKIELWVKPESKEAVLKLDQWDSKNNKKPGKKKL